MGMPSLPTATGEQEARTARHGMRKHARTYGHRAWRDRKRTKDCHRSSRGLVRVGFCTSVFETCRAPASTLRCRGGPSDRRGQVRPPRAISPTFKRRQSRRWQRGRPPVLETEASKGHLAKRAAAFEVLWGSRHSDARGPVEGVSVGTRTGCRKRDRSELP